VDGRQKCEPSLNRLRRSTARQAERPSQLRHDAAGLDDDALRPRTTTHTSTADTNDGPSRHERPHPSSVRRPGAACDAQPLTLYRRLYRRSLKLSLDWAVHRYLWRGQALYLRGLFEANKNITEPRQQRVRLPTATTHTTRRFVRAC
jgi:hypothetical protein